LGYKTGSYPAINAVLERALVEQVLPDSAGPGFETAAQAEQLQCLRPKEIRTGSARFSTLAHSEMKMQKRMNRRTWGNIPPAMCRIIAVQKKTVQGPMAVTL